MQKAMYYQDAKVSSHAIISEDKDTFDIFEAIDRVTYSKVLRPIPSTSSTQ